MGRRTTPAASGADCAPILEGDRPAAPERVGRPLPDGPGLRPDDLRAGALQSPEVGQRFDSKRILRPKLAPGVAMERPATPAAGAGPSPWAGSGRSLGDGPDEEPTAAETRRLIGRLDSPTSRMPDAPIARSPAETTRRIIDGGTPIDEDRRGIRRGDAHEDPAFLEAHPSAKPGHVGAPKERRERGPAGGAEARAERAGGRRPGKPRFAPAS